MLWPSTDPHFVQDINCSPFESIIDLSNKQTVIATQRENRMMTAVWQHCNQLIQHSTKNLSLNVSRHNVHISTRRSYLLSFCQWMIIFSFIETFGCIRCSMLTITFRNFEIILIQRDRRAERRILPNVVQAYLRWQLMIISVSRSVHSFGPCTRILRILSPTSRNCCSRQNKMLQLSS